MKQLMSSPMLFDMKRMLYGGFSTIVKMGVTTEERKSKGKKR
jgi:hypothetical protein